MLPGMTRTSSVQCKANMLHSGHYSVLPAISVCCEQRHSRSGSANSGDGLSNRTSNGLDLHTSECPIEMSTLNAALSLDALGLVDCAIDGVLNIYAVERRLSMTSLCGLLRSLRGKKDIILGVMEGGNRWVKWVVTSIKSHLVKKAEENLVIAGPARKWYGRICRPRLCSGTVRYW